MSARSTVVIHGPTKVIARIGFGVAEEAVQRDETGFVAVHIEAKFVIVSGLLIYNSCAAPGSAGMDDGQRPASAEFLNVCLRVETGQV